MGFTTPRIGHASLTIPLETSYNVWRSNSSFDVNIAFGNLSFAYAKLIDVFCDVVSPTLRLEILLQYLNRELQVIERGVLAILTLISYLVFRTYVSAQMNSYTLEPFFPAASQKGSCGR